jgi:hypothetical protein
MLDLNVMLDVFQEIKGFSERDIGYMIRFAKEYGTSILPNETGYSIRIT